MKALCATLVLILTSCAIVPTPNGAPVSRVVLVCLFASCHYTPPVTCNPAIEECPEP